jgi:hypothetical protein
MRGKNIKLPLVSPLLAEILKDPNNVWALLNLGKAVKILGPWEKFSDQVYRRLPSGEPFVVVYSSTRQSKPQEYYFRDEYYLPDPEAFARALAKWEADQAAWKPWTYATDYDKETHPYGFADSKEEAMALADDSMLKRGWLLAGLIGLE